MPTPFTSPVTDSPQSSGSTASNLDESASASRLAAAFGWGAAVSIVFNTVLAFIKDAYDPLNNVMKAMTGHHWITHGLAVVIVFVVVGWLLLARGTTAPSLSNGTVIAVVVAAIVAGAGLAGWFFLV